MLEAGGGKSLEPGFARKGQRVAAVKAAGVQPGQMPSEYAIYNERLMPQWTLWFFPTVT